MKQRVELFDWLRGWASFLVVADHCKAAPETYTVWSVNLFIMMTATLFSKSTSSLTSDKLLRRLAYLVFAYCSCLFILGPALSLFGVKGLPPDLGSVIDVRWLFIENPYLGHLWYIPVYTQLLLFMWASLPFVHRINKAVILVLGFVIGEAYYYFSHQQLRAYHSIFLPAWAFYWAFGYAVMPAILKKLSERPARAALRSSCSIAVFMLMVMLFNGIAPGWVSASHRPSFLMLPLIVAGIWLLSDLYHLIEGLGWSWLRRFFVTCGSLTLYVYISHDAYRKLFQQYLPNPLLTLTVLMCAFATGWLFHQAYLRLEARVGGVR